MKVAITSDIHLEFGEWYPSNPENADVLILSGDILVADNIRKLQEDPHRIIDHSKADIFVEFLRQCKQNYKEVVYVMGNHEHYHGDFALSAETLRRECKDHGIHFLDCDNVVIGDYTFIGGTLWTDMNNEDPLTMHSMTGMMNDFRIVNNSNRMVSRKVPIYQKDDEGNYVMQERNGINSMVEIGMKHVEQVARFSPADAVEQHRKMVEYIKMIISLNPTRKYVVVGHHAPSKASTHPRYKDEYMMNGGYSSNLDEFILDHPQIKLWTHGHTHELFDYRIGSTRVVCNPRGYVYYERGSDKEEPYHAKVVELP
jgi:Icc-related predicted phosphoesterase